MDGDVMLDDLDKYVRYVRSNVHVSPRDNR